MLVLDLCRASAPFTQYMFGSAIANKLVACVPSPTSPLQERPPSEAPPLWPPPHWASVVAPAWCRWLAAFCAPPTAMPTRLPRGRQPGYGKMLTLLWNDASGADSSLHNNFEEGLAAGELSILAYLLETAMRRVMWGIAQRRALSEPQRGKGGALHSVLLKDISKALLDAFVVFCSQSSMGLEGTPNNNSAEEIARVGVALRELHAEFVDPTEDGLNLRNLIQHGFLFPIIGTSGTLSDTRDGDDVKRSSTLLRYVRCRLLAHMETVATLALLLLRRDIVMDALPDTTNPREEYVLLSEVRLEREPRRQEAVDALVEVLCDGSAGDHPPASGSPEPRIIDEDHQMGGVDVVACLLALFPLFERCLRLVVVSAATTKGDASRAPIEEFAPKIGLPFADLEALFALASRYVELPVLEVAVGGGGPDAPGLGISSPSLWRWWEAVLVAPEGPRLRDVLVHCKWDPLKGKALAAGPLSLAAACPTTSSHPNAPIQAVKSLGNLLLISLRALSSFVRLHQRSNAGEVVLHNMYTYHARCVQHIPRIPTHTSFSSVALAWRRLDRLLEAMAGTGTQRRAVDTPTQPTARWALQSTSIGRSAGAPRTRQHKLMTLATAGDGANEAGTSDAPPATTRTAEELSLWADAQLQLVREARIAQQLNHPDADAERRDALPAGASASVGEVHIVLFAWATFVEAQDAKTEELLGRVEARTAREQQRLQLSMMMVFKPLLLKLVASLVGRILLTLTPTAATAPNCHGDIRRQCRSMASLLATSNLGALSLVIGGLVDQLEVSTTVPAH